MMIVRLHEERGGGEDLLAQLREKMSEVDAKRNRQAAENGILMHAQWQARNGMQLQVQMNDKGRRARQLLVQRRKQLITKGRGDVANLSVELERQQEQMIKAAADADAEDATLSATRIFEQQKVAGRLRRLEEQFRRVQELMGFATIDDVVEKLIEQRQVRA